MEAGQVLLSVEAMKMEHQLVAPLDGTVHISVSAGDLVKADQVLATIHPAVPTGALESGGHDRGSRHRDGRGRMTDH